jgi:hypothetical protein
MLTLSHSETQEVGFNIPLTYSLQHVSWRLFSRLLSLNYHRIKIHLKYTKSISIYAANIIHLCGGMFISDVDGSGTTCQDLKVKVDDPALSCWIESIH